MRKRKTDNRVGGPLSSAEIIALQKKLYSTSEYRTCEPCSGTGGRNGHWCVNCNGAGKVRVPTEGML